MMPAVDAASAWAVRVPMLKADGVVLRPHGESLVVYEYLIGGFYVLNRTARLILEQMDGRRSVTEVARLVAAATGGNITLGDVIETLVELEALHVLNIQDAGIPS